MCSQSNKKTIEPRIREQFIRSAGGYANSKGHSLLIVFDGGHFPWPQVERKSNLLTVVWAGQGNSADDYITAYIVDHKQADILLVTNDRQLCSLAARYNKASLGATDFFDLVMAHESTPSATPVVTQAQKLPGRQADPEVDQLMLEGSGMRSPVKEEIRPKRHKHLGKKNKKHERVLLSKVKKL